MSEYKVKKGDCLSNIASDHGLFWETIWNHPDNKELKDKRKDHNILFPGDMVFIPEKSERDESGSTEQKHRFRVKGVPAKLRIQLMEFNKPLAQIEYTLEIDNQTFEGKTDDEGRIEQSIPPDAQKGRLLYGEEHKEYILKLGQLDPVDEPKGVQERLNNLGLYSGKIDGEIGPDTIIALKKFQKENEIEETGEIDEKTQKKLVEIHGS